MAQVIRAGIFSCLLQIFLFGVTVQVDYGITLDCPAEFTVGQTATLECVVDTAHSAISGCSFPPEKVVFQIESEQRCSTTYNPGSCTTSVGGLASEECGCTGEVGSVQTYSFKYTAKEGDAGRRLTCAICVPWTSSAPSNCDSITLAEGSGARGLHLTWMVGGFVTALTLAVFTLLHE